MHARLRATARRLHGSARLHASARPARRWRGSPARRALSGGEPAVGSADLDWARIGFDYQATNGFVKFTWADGKWDGGVWEREPYLKLHVMSSAIHYGQAIYEGAKAHHCADGAVRLWNIRANARRMTEGTDRMMMPAVDADTFARACEWAVAGNLAFVPPYGSRGSMYLRPFIFGHGPQLGLSPAPTFHFCVLAIPVASYYAGGLNPIDALVASGHDRAAPDGVGHVKAAGNYGADIRVSIDARSRGYATVLYLDAREKRYVEEFSVANFVGIRDDVYATPDAATILRSTTNDCLATLAEHDFGMRVDRRPIAAAELGDFDEVAGVGTAVVMMGVKSITHNDTVHRYGRIDRVEQLYDRYRAIQFGDAPDVFGWGARCRPLADVAS